MGVKTASSAIADVVRMGVKEMDYVPTVLRIKLVFLSLEFLSSIMLNANLYLLQVNSYFVLKMLEVCFSILGRGASSLMLHPAQLSYLESLSSSWYPVL